MTEGNNPGTDRKNSYYFIFCPDILKSYQTETKLLEFSRNKDREDLKIRKSDVNLHYRYFATTSTPKSVTTKLRTLYEVSGVIY